MRSKVIADREQVGKTGREPLGGNGSDVDFGKAEPCDRKGGRRNVRNPSTASPPFGEVPSRGRGDPATARALERRRRERGTGDRRRQREGKGGRRVSEPRDRRLYRSADGRREDGMQPLPKCTA